MKEGWKYRKLGEVCEIVSGSTPKTNIPEYWGVGHYWVTPAELNENTLYINSTERQITDKAIEHTNLQLLPIGTVLLSSRAPIGKVAITNVEMYCNQGFKNCICTNEINNKYLYYFLKGKKDYLNELGRGATFKEISKSIVEKVLLPVPPLAEQQAIVAELDKINQLIALKKSQLANLDLIAQSIFYEMFGDPVENEKGWEVKKWSDVLTIINGKNQKAVESPNGNYPIYGSGGIMSYANDWLCPADCIVLGRKGNINKPLFVHTKFWNVDTAFGLNAKREILVPTYLYYFCLNYDFERHNKAVTIPSLTKVDLLKISIPLPPLPLQQTFAERVEVIEKLKEQVSAMIKDLETLLASRMQYWFD